MIMKIDGLGPEEFAGLATFLASEKNRIDGATAFFEEGTAGSYSHTGKETGKVCLLKNSTCVWSGHNVVIEIHTRYTREERYDHRTIPGEPVPEHYVRDLLASMRLFPAVE